MAIWVATRRFFSAASPGCRELTSSSALEIRLSIRSSAFTPSPLRPETSTYGRWRSSSDSGMPRSAQQRGESGVANSSNAPVRLIVMGYKIPDGMKVQPTPKLMLANADDVQLQILGGHGPTSQFKLLMGLTSSERDKLAAAYVMDSLFIMDFAPGGTNIPHNHPAEEEIYLLLRGSASEKRLLCRRPYPHAPACRAAGDSMQTVKIRLRLMGCTGLVVLACALVAAGSEQAERLNRDFQKAVAQYDAGHFPEAAAQLENLLRDAPESFEVHELLGLVYAGESP